MSAYGQIVIIKRTGEDGSCFPVLTKTCKIGRGNVCDIRVQRDGVSDEQCIIETRTDAQVWIRNLTHNQTLLNGVPVTNKGAALKHKDIFVVSDRAFRWEYMPGSKFYCIIKDDSTQSVKAPSEIIRKDEKSKVQTEAMKQVGSPALRTPGRKSNRRSILETVTNVRGWSVFDMSDRSEKLHNAENVLQSPEKPTNNSTFDLIDFEDSVRSYLEEEIECSGEKQRGSISILKRSLRKSNDRRGSATPKLLKSAKKADESSSKALEDKNRLIPKKSVASDYANSSLSSLEKVNLELSDFTEDSSATLNDSVFNTKESGSFVGSPAVEENLTSHVTVGRTRGRRFSSDKIPFVTPALLKRPSNKREYQSSNSLGSIVDSVKGKIVEAENSVSSDSRSAATDELSFVSSNLSDNTGCGDESMNENNSQITSEEESEESMSRAFVNVRISRRCKNLSSNSSPFVTPAILKSMKRNVRKSSKVSGLSLGEQKFSSNSFDEVEHNMSSPKSKRRTRSNIEFPEDLSQNLNKDVVSNEECINQKESDAVKQLDETPLKIPAQSSCMAQEVERSDGDHPVTVHSLHQSNTCDSPTSVKLKSGKTPHKKFMGQEEDPQPKSSRKTIQHNADSQNEFDLVMSSSECMDEASQIFSEGEVDSILSYSVASTANATNGTLLNVTSESFISTVPSSSSLEKLDSAEVCPGESREVVPNTLFDTSVECFGANSKKEEIMDRESGLASQGNISVSKDEIVENDKENLDESPLGLSSEEMVDMSKLKSTESNLFSQRSPRRSLRKSLQNIPNQEITDSVLEDQRLMTPVGNIPDTSAKDESVKSKRKTRKSVIEQENVPIITDEKEEYGKGLEKSIEEDRKDLSMSNTLEASTASSVKSITKTPRARKSLGDLSLIESNAVKSNRKSQRYSKSRVLDDSSALAFIQEGGVSLSKTPIAGENEQNAKIESAKSLRKTRQSEITPKGSVSIIGNSAGIVKVVDSIDSSGVCNKESSLICNLSVSNKSSRRTPGKIKLARRISEIASLSSQEEIDSCFEGLMGDLLKTPVSKITSEGGKSLQKEKKSGIKSKNVSFNLDHSSMSNRDAADKMASSLLEDECEESLINPLDSSLTSFSKLRSSSGKCKGVYTFSSTPISNTSRKLNLSKNPASDVVQKAVHSPITEEEAADIAVSPPKTRGINFDDLEESSATTHEVSESDEMHPFVESSISSEVEDRTSSKSLLSALSSVKSNKTTPSGRKKQTDDSLLASSSSLGFSLHLSESSLYEDAISDSVKILSSDEDKEVNMTREESFKALPYEDSSINDKNVSENCEEISSILEEDTTVVEHKQLDGSSVINSAKIRSDLVQEMEDSQTGDKFEALMGDDKNKSGSAEEVRQESLSNDPSSVKSVKKTPKNRKVEKKKIDESHCLEGVSDLMKTPAVETTRSIRKLRSSDLVQVMEDSQTGEKIEELMGDGENEPVAAEELCQESSLSCAPSSVKSVKKTPKQRKEEMDESHCLDGVGDLMKTPAVETTRSIRKLRSSDLVQVMEDSQTGEKIEELMGDGENEPVAAEEVGQESTLSCAPSSVKSVKKTPKKRKVEMDESHCLDGVGDLMKTPAVETTRSLRKLRSSDLVQVMEDSQTGVKIEELMGDGENEPVAAEEVGQESSLSCAPSSVKSVKKTPKKRKVEMDESHCLDGVGDLMKTPAVETTRSLRKLRSSDLVQVMEDSQTGEKIEELMGDGENEPVAAEELCQESSLSCAPSSVKSVKKTPKQRKEEMDESHCLDGVGDLMKTPAVETTRSLRKLRSSDMVQVMEDSQTGEKIEELMGDGENEPVAAEEVGQESSLSCAPSSVKSVKKTPKQRKEEMDESHCLDGVGDLMKTPAVETTRSIRQLRSSDLVQVMEDSQTGVKIEELMGDGENEPVAAEEVGQESILSCAPSSVKSVKKTPKNRKVEKKKIDESHCLEGVSDLMKTPAVETTRSIRKLRSSDLVQVMEDSQTGEKIEELMGDGENEPVAAEELCQESSLSCAPSSVKSVKKTPKQRKEEMDESHCLDGVGDLMKTPAVETTRSIRKLRSSDLVQVMEDSQTGEKIEELMSDDENEPVAAEEVVQESTLSCAPSSVKSVKKTPKQRKEEMDESHCLDGVGDLMKTPAVETTRSLRKLRSSDLVQVMEDSQTGEKIEELMGDGENEAVAAEELCQESSLSCAPSSVKSVKKTPKKRKVKKKQMDQSLCLEGVSHLMQTPAVISARSLRKSRRVENESLVEDVGIEENIDLQCFQEGDNHASEKESQDYSIYSPSSWIPCSVKSVKNTPILKNIDEEHINDSLCLERVDNYLHTTSVKLTESLRKRVLSSVKSIKKTPKYRKFENDHMNDSHCLEGVSDLMQTPTVSSSKSLRKFIPYGFGEKGNDLNLEESSADVSINIQDVSDLAEEIRNESLVVHPPSSAQSSVKSIKNRSKQRKGEKEKLNDSIFLEGVSSLMETPAMKSASIFRKSRTFEVESEKPTEGNIEELKGDNDDDQGLAGEVSPESQFKRTSLYALSSVKSIKETPKHRKIEKNKMNDSSCLDGVSNLMQTPVVKSAKSHWKTRSKIETTMEDLRCEDSITEWQGSNECSPNTAEDVGQESSISSSSLSGPNSVKSVNKTPKHRKIEKEQINDSVCLEGINNLMQTPAVNLAESLRKTRRSGMVEINEELNLEESTPGIRSSRDDELSSAEEMENESLIVHPPLSAPSSVKSIKKTPKQRKIDKEQINDSHCLDGVSNLIQTPVVKSRKSLRQTRGTEIESKIMEMATEESIPEVRSGVENALNVVDEISNESLIVHKTLSVPSSIKSFKKTPKHRKGEKEQIDDSYCLDGITNLMQTPGVKSAKKPYKLNVSFAVEDISKRCLGDADEPNISHIKEDRGMSLVQSPARNIQSSQKLRKKIGKSIGGSGSPSFTSTPLVKRPNKSLSLSNNFENVVMINSRKSELNAENVDSSLVESSGLGMVVNEAKRKTPNSNESWLVSDLTPTSSHNSINATGDTSAFEVENGDKMKEYLTVEEGGNAIRKTSLSVRSTRRMRSQLEDSSHLSGNGSVFNEKPHDEGNESSVLGDMDCSWVTSSTFSFVRTPESSKMKSSEKKRESEISTIVSRDVGDAPLMNFVENTGTERLDVVDEKQEGPKTAGEKNCQNSDDKLPQPVSSYEDVRGVKEVMTRRSPLSRYSGFVGVKELFAPKSPTCSYENVSGVKELMSHKSPQSRYSDVRGLRKLFNQKSPVCDYGNVSGVQDLFNVSSESKDKQMAVINIVSELSDKSTRANDKSCVKLKSAVVVIQKLDGKLIDHASKKDNLGVRNPKSKKVSRGSDEGAAESSSLKPDVSAELLQSTAENQENPVRLSGDEKISNLPKSSKSDAVSGESKSGQTIRRGRLQKSKSKEKDVNLEGTEDLSSRSRRALRGNKSTSATVETDAKKIVDEKAEASSMESCNKLGKLQSKRTKSLSVSEESESLPERTKPSISNSVGEEYQSSQTNRRGRVQKSKSKEKDVDVEGTEDSSSTSRRALRRNRSTSDTVGEDSKTRESNERSSVQKSKEKDQELDGTADSTSTGRRALRGDRPASLAMSEESEPLPKARKISSISDTVDEEGKTKEANGRGRVKKSKEKDQELEGTVDSSRSERRALRGNRSNSLTVSEESEPLPKTTKLSSLISDTVDEESKTKEANGRGRVKKSKSKEKDQELEGTVDSSSSGRRALRRDRSTSVTTETDAKKRVSKKAEISSLESCDKPLNLLPKKMKSVTFELNKSEVKETVDKKALTSALESGDKSHSLRQKRTKSSSMSEENELLPKRTKSLPSISDAVHIESNSSQTNRRGKPQKSKSKEKDLNLEATEDLSSTSRRTLRGNKSSSEIIETDAKEKEMEISCMDSKDKLGNLQQNRTASLTPSEESEPLPKTTKHSLISDAVSGEGKLEKTNRRGRLQKSKSKDNESNLEGTEDLSSTSRRTLRRNKSTCITVLEESEPKRTKLASSVIETIGEESKSSQASERGRVQKSKSKEKDMNLEGTEDSSSTSRRALRGNKSVSVAIETDAKKRVGKKAEVSSLDSGNELGKLRSKRTKSISTSEENEPSPKRIKHGSSVGETIDEERKSSQASERGGVQKSKSKEKNVNLEGTEDSSSTSRRTLRGNKSTSAAVSEGVLKKNASKINKNTASPDVAPSEKENGKTTDAKSAKTEDISKIQVPKSKPLKKDLSVSEVKRITRKTSVDKGGDSVEKSHKKEISLRNKGKVEKVVGRVTRGQKKEVEFVNKRKP